MAIFKLILALALVFSSAFVGLHLSRRLSRRCELLREFVKLLTSSALRISYTGSDLAAVFSENFAGCAFSSDRPFCDQWTEWIQSMRDSLKADDLALLTQFAQGIGTSDTDAQQKHFRMYTELLEGQVEEAQKELEQKGRIYRILPLSAGVVLALFII